MANVATFPDVEQWLCDNLAIESLPVSTAIPNPRPAEFFRVVRTGGPIATRVSDQPTVAVEAFAANEGRALSLLSAARAWLHDAQGNTVNGVMVKTVTESAGPGNLPHPDIPGARYTMTVALHLRSAT